MKAVPRILSRACVYAVIITVLFALIGLFSSMEEATIPLVQFLIICLFAFLISLAQQIFLLEKWKFILRLGVHFLALYSSFMCIFYATGKITTQGASGFFVSTFLFTFGYFLIFFVSKLLRLVYKKITASPKKEKRV